MFRRLFFTGFLLAALVLHRSRPISMRRQVPGHSADPSATRVFLRHLSLAPRPLHRTGLPKPFTDGRSDLDGRGRPPAEHGVRSQCAAAALASGKIDLVLADPTTSREIGGLVNTASTALVVPILVDSAVNQRAVLEKEFGCVMPLAESRKVIDALDRAMKLRAKRAAAPHSA